MNAVRHSSASTASPAYSAFTSLMHWQEPLATRLQFRHDLPGQQANRLLNIELGLFLMVELLPFAAPEALPDLLNGEGIAYRHRPVWTPRQHRYLSRARTLLAPYRNRETWLKALTIYANLRPGLRVFTVQGQYTNGVSSFGLHERLSLFRKALV
ncbi:hypothetical protein [Nibrella saemangeumensis]